MRPTGSQDQILVHLPAGSVVSFTAVNLMMGLERMGYHCWIVDETVMISGRCVTPTMTAYLRFYEPDIKAMVVARNDERIERPRVMWMAI
jgi:hypothetical protein